VSASTAVAHRIAAASTVISRSLLTNR